MLDSFLNFSRNGAGRIAFLLLASFRVMVALKERDYARTMDPQSPAGVIAYRYGVTRKCNGISVFDVLPQQRHGTP